MVLQPISPVSRRAPRRRLRDPRARALLFLLGLLLQERAAAAKVDSGLAAVQKAALAHAGLSPGATTGLLARQHLAALLPQLRVTVGRGWQLSATGRALDGLTAPVIDDDHTSYAVSASWDLARLLVPHEAMQHHQQEPRRAQQRLALLVQVTQLVAARCRLLQSEPQRPEQPEQPEQVAELEAALALLTGGSALPEVSAETACPAAPRFSLARPRGELTSRRVSPSRRGASLPADDGSALPDSLGGGLGDGLEDASGDGLRDGPGDLWNGAGDGRLGAAAAAD